MIFKSISLLTLLPAVAAFGGRNGKNEDDSLSWRMKYCSEDGSPMYGFKCPIGSLAQPWWPHQQVCGNGPGDCGERHDASGCAGSWLGDLDLQSVEYECVAVPGAFNGYVIKSLHYASTDCSGDVDHSESKTNCWNDELNIHNVNVCLGDNNINIRKDSEGNLNDCVSTIEAIAAGAFEAMGVPASIDVCDDPSALSPLGAPDNWFIGNCCHTCGQAIGSDLRDW